MLADKTKAGPVKYTPVLKDKNEESEEAGRKTGLENHSAKVVSDTQETNVNESLSTLEAPDVIIDEVDFSSVALAWFLSAEDIASKLESKQTVRVEISMSWF